MKRIIFVAILALIFSCSKKSEHIEPDTYKPKPAWIDVDASHLISSWKVTHTDKHWREPAGDKIVAITFKNNGTALVTHINKRTKASYNKDYYWQYIKTLERNGEYMFPTLHLGDKITRFTEEDDMPQSVGLIQVHALYSFTIVEKYTLIGTERFNHILKLSK